MTKILACGEGAHDIGDLTWNPKDATYVHREGWLQPLIRKVLHGDVDISTKYLKELVLLPRPNALKPIPRGHSDKAAIARLVAKSSGCDVVVFMTDADTNVESERKRKVKEISDGFDLIANDVSGVACVPRSASESWLLSDEAAWRSIGLKSSNFFPKVCPEDLWGARDDVAGNHPKHAFARVSVEANMPDNRETRHRVCEASSIGEMKRRCPASLVEFVDALSSGAEKRGNSDTAE